MSVDYSAGQYNRADECTRAENGLEVDKQGSGLLANDVCTAALLDIELRFKLCASGLPLCATWIFDLIHVLTLSLRFVRNAR